MKARESMRGHDLLPLRPTWAGCGQGLSDVGAVLLDQPVEGPREMTLQFRQGDILLRAITAIPTGAKAVRCDSTRVIIAEGELSGHTHAFPAARVRRFEDSESGQSFLAIGKGGSALQHDEHAAIEVPSGFFEVVRQREYQPRRTRLVAD